MGVELPATTVVGSFYQPATTYAGAYYPQYQPTAVTYQTLPTNYQPMSASTITYQGALQNSSLLMNRMPFNFTADATDAKEADATTAKEGKADEKADETADKKTATKDAPGPAKKVAKTKSKCFCC